MTEAACAVGIIMGSQSDWETMQHAAHALDRLGIAYETRIVSAHRTPDRLYEYARSAQARGLKIIIAGAGGAAHLPGMAAALTPLPVLGVPVESRTLRGVDRLGDSAVAAAFETWRRSQTDAVAEHPDNR